MNCVNVGAVIKQEYLNASLLQFTNFQVSDSYEFQVNLVSRKTVTCKCFKCHGTPTAVQSREKLTLWQRWSRRMSDREKFIGDNRRSPFEIGLYIGLSALACSDGFGGLVISMLASGAPSSRVQTRPKSLKFSGIWKFLRMPSFGGEVKESAACKRT